MSSRTKKIKSLSLTINLWVLLLGIFLGSNGISSAFGDDDENCATSHFYFLEGNTEADSDQGGGEDEDQFFLSSENEILISHSYDRIVRQFEKSYVAVRGSVPLYVLYHNFRFDDKNV